MVIWIIGLSGAGKTTLARETVRIARNGGTCVALLDGDELREVWGDDLGHDMIDRRRNADRICRLCALLDRQGMHVVCAVLSLFEESRDWNRSTYSAYHEVFVDTPLSDLRGRDPKKLYARHASGDIRGLPGIDLPFRPPAHPDLVIANTGSLDGLLSHAEPLAGLLVGDSGGQGTRCRGNGEA